MPPPPPTSTLFPYTTLFRSRRGHEEIRFEPALGSAEPYLLRRHTDRAWDAITPRTPRAKAESCRLSRSSCARGQSGRLPIRGWEHRDLPAELRISRHRVSRAACRRGDG